jgi:hypothetical protein
VPAHTVQGGNTHSYTAEDAQQNYEPRAARFISLHRVVIKQVRIFTYRATILRNLQFMTVGIQFVQHVFHSSVQLVFEISPPPPPINIQLVTFTITHTQLSLLTKILVTIHNYKYPQKKIFRQFSSRQLQRIYRRITTALLCVTSRCDIHIKGGMGAVNLLPPFLPLIVLLQLFRAIAPEVNGKSMTTYGRVKLRPQTGTRWWRVVTFKRRSNRTLSGHQRRSVRYGADNNFLTYDVLQYSRAGCESAPSYAHSPRVAAL